MADTADPSAHIAIDLDEVREMIVWLRRESEVLAQERHTLQPAVHFGQFTPCGEANAARGALMTALDGFQTGIDEHRRHVLALTGALEQAAAQYTAADQLGTTNVRNTDR